MFLHANKQQEIDKEKESVTWNKGALVAELAVGCGGGQEEYGRRCRGSRTEAPSSGETQPSTPLFPMFHFAFSSFIVNRLPPFVLHVLPCFFLSFFSFFLSFSFLSTPVLSV